MSDSSSAPKRISEAAVASLVQRYCRKARTTSKTTIPERISGQKLRNPLYRRQRESPRLDGFLVKAGKAHSQRAKLKIAAGMTGICCNLWPEKIRERGAVNRPDNQLTVSLTGRIFICISLAVKNRERAENGAHFTQGSADFYRCEKPFEPFCGVTVL